MPQNGSVEEIFDNGKVDETLLSTDKSDICSPFLVRAISFEILIEQIRIGVDRSRQIGLLSIGVPLASNRTDVELSHQT